MGLYGEAQKIEIHRAIVGMVNLVLSAGSRDKVLLVPITITTSNYETEQTEYINYTIVVYKPHNYCFVGMVDGSNNLHLSDGDDVHFESYHDSCWRDGLSRMVRAKATELTELYDNQEGISSFISFGFHSPRLVDGFIDMNDEFRTAKFKILLPRN